MALKRRPYVFQQVLQANELVNVSALRAHAAQGPEISLERRQESLEGWIDIAVGSGQPVRIDGVNVVPCDVLDTDFRDVLRKYLRVDGVGRAHLIGYGGQNCTRETRRCGYEGLHIGELDMVIAFYQLCVEALRRDVPVDVFDDVTTPILRCIENLSVYREKVATCYSITVDQVKEIFTRLPFGGYIQPDESWESPNSNDLLPCLLELRHAFRRGQGALAQHSPQYIAIRQLPKVLSAPHSDATALAIYLQNEENVTLGIVASTASSHGARLQSYVFDGMYVLCTSSDELLRVYRTTAADVHQRTGIRLALKDVDGKVIEAHRPCERSTMICVFVVATDANGEHKYSYNVDARTCSKSLMHAWCQARGVSPQETVFALPGGREIPPIDTPINLGWSFASKGPLEIRAMPVASAEAIQSHTQNASGDLLATASPRC